MTDNTLASTPSTGRHPPSQSAPLQTVLAEAVPVATPAASNPTPETAKRTVTEHPNSADVDDSVYNRSTTGTTNVQSIHTTATTATTGTTVSEKTGAKKMSSFSRIFERVFGHHPKPQQMNTTHSNESVQQHLAPADAAGFNDATSTAINTVTNPAAAKKKSTEEQPKKINKIPQKQRVLPKSSTSSKPPLLKASTKDHNSGDIATQNTAKKRKENPETDINVAAKLTKKVKANYTTTKDTQVTDDVNPYNNKSIIPDSNVAESWKKRQTPAVVAERQEKQQSRQTIVTEGQQPKQRGRPPSTKKKIIKYRPVQQNDIQIQQQQIHDAVIVVTQTLRSSAYPALFMNHMYEQYHTKNRSSNENTNSDDNNNSNNNDNVTLWPCPYRTLNGKTGSSVPNKTQLPSSAAAPSPPPSNSVNTMTQHCTHMSSVCASIEKFANDIVQPAILGEYNHSLLLDQSKQQQLRPPDAKYDSSCNENVLDTIIASSRAFFGTLLLLRELLIQNVHAIFGPSVIMSLPNHRHPSPSSLPQHTNNHHRVTTTTTTPQNQHQQQQQPSSMQLSLSEVHEFEKQIFVSAIILTGLQDATMDDANYYLWNHYGSNDVSRKDFLMDAFLHCMDMYDRGHPDFFDCLQVLKNQDPCVTPDTHSEVTVVEDTDAADTIVNEKNPAIRAVFANRHLMNDNEHLAWTISCNYQRTMHPIYVHHIYRIEKVKERQRQLIYNTLNPIRIDADMDTATSTNPTARAIRESEDEKVELLHRKRSGLNVISPTPTAVHISILKIQSKINISNEK